MGVRMDRRAFLIVAAGAGLFLYDRMYQPPLSENGKKVVLYVGAKDCGACRAYEASGRSQFAALVRKRGWSYREANLASLSRLNDPKAWPADLRWALQESGGVSATPTFLLFDEGKEKRREVGFADAEYSFDRLIG